MARTAEDKSKIFKRLKEWQNLKLEQKIDHAVGTIEAFKARTGHDVYVSFSGGKDSTVLLDIARRFVYKDIKAVFMNTGNEFPEIIEYVKKTPNVEWIKPAMTIQQVINNEGFPLISKDTSEKIRQIKHTKSERLRQIRLHGYEKNNGRMAKCPMKWQYLAREKFDVSERCCDVMKKRAFKKYEKDTGLYPLIGVTAAESRLRTMQYISRGGCSAFEGPRPRSFPISIFTDKDIYEYCARFKIALSHLYDDNNVRQSGCMVCGFGADQDPQHFDYIYTHYPKAYKYFMSMTNNGVTYREALHACHIKLPDD